MDNDSDSSSGGDELKTKEDQLHQGNERKCEPSKLKQPVEETIAGVRFSQGTPCLGRLSNQVKARALKAASKFVSNYPFFKIVMQSTYLHSGYLRIPKQFSSAHIKGSSRKAMLWASDRFWPVKLLVYPLWSSVLTTGWVDFVKENALREGDVCVFEMYGSNDVVLKGFFDQNSRGKKMGKPGRNVSFSDANPEFFKVYIPDFSDQHLRIPPAFVKEFSGNIPNNAILRDIRGKYCHVELKEVEKDVFIKNGWQEFVRGHSVEQGDFLVFRYHGKALFDVSIFGRNGCRKDESSDIVTTDEIAICVKNEEGTEEELTMPPHGYKQLQLEFGIDRTENSGSLEVGRRKSRRIAAMNSVKCMRPEAATFVIPKNPHFITFIGRSSRYNLEEKDLDTTPGSLDKIVEVEDGRVGGNFGVKDTCAQKCLYIPQHVLKNNNIKLEGEMVMRDQKDRSWPMRLTTRKDGRLALVKGWAKFWKENNLGRRDQCVFEFILGRGRISKEIHVQVIRAIKMTKNNCRR
ncbi:putative B3 domain-containing protein [Vitis vinifera]|uniref:Putative B3 domain-containing protein n=1 Tax=Vitis vinifera TaxID=29760 RepID=A0A438FCA8_VITVI|nr:putative B3 domain-containing protein [Vitis vinifera]